MTVTVTVTVTVDRDRDSVTVTVWLSQWPWLWQCCHWYAQCSARSHHAHAAHWAFPAQSLARMLQVVFSTYPGLSRLYSLSLSLHTHTHTHIYIYRTSLGGPSQSDEQFFNQKAKAMASKQRVTRLEELCTERETKLYKCMSREYKGDTWGCIQMDKQHT